MDKCKVCGEPFGLYCECTPEDYLEYRNEELIAQVKQLQGERDVLKEENENVLRANRYILSWQQMLCDNLVKFGVATKCDSHDKNCIVHVVAEIMSIFKKQAKVVEAIRETTFTSHQEDDGRWIPEIVYIKILEALANLEE